MNAVYRTVAARIRADLRELAQVVERATRIWQHTEVSAESYHVDATALNLHSFYTGLERLLEAIADGIDQAKPSGPNWHQELLRQMSAEIPHVRPPVLSPATRDRLDRYRGFRHVVRNVYAFTLDAEQIELLMRGLSSTMEQVSQELLAFADFLERLDP